MFLLAVQVTIVRPKDETKEEKRARKQAVKETRKSRRVDKKATKDLFAVEKKQQINVLKGTNKGIRHL